MTEKSDSQGVTFRWKDYAHGNKQRKMTLSASEFLRRFTQHILAPRFRPHPAIWIPGQHASLCPTRSRTPTPRRSATRREIATRHRRHLHLPMSSMQCRNANWPQSVRPAVGRPVQVSGQFVSHANRRGPITCPPARTYLCLCGRRDSLPPCSPSIGNTFPTVFRNPWTAQMQPSRHLSVYIYLHGQHQNPKNTLAAP